MPLHNTDYPASSGDPANTRLEEAALNATAVRQQILYDGWLLRWAPAKARRARSINIIGPSQLPLEEKLAYCRTVYLRHEQPLIFRLTSMPSGLLLDARLHERGHARTDDTYVMTRFLDGGMQSELQQTLRYEQVEPDVFAHTAGMLRDFSIEHVEEHARRLAGIAVPCLRLLARDEEGGCVAAGMAVFDADAVGLFDIVVDERVRRRGYARQLAWRLLQAGREQGARNAYLQVEHANTAARQLYTALGFDTRYAYWYRTYQHN